MLNIDIEYRRGILFIRLNGVLNKNTSCILKDVSEKMISKAGIKYVLINLEKLYYIDSSGINTIIGTYKKLIDGKLIICGYQDNNMIKIDDTEIFNYAMSTKDELSAFKLIHI